MSEKATALVDHYHRTYDVAYKLWEQRNRAFLLLVGLLLIAALFTNELVLTTSHPRDGSASQRAGSSAQGPNFIITWICTQASSCTDQRLAELKQDFPRQTFNLGVSLLIFYLMMNMFSYSNSISRYYAYIVALEAEIRCEFHIVDGIAFTREGRFAAERRSILGRLVGHFYWLVLASLLILHFGSRVMSEWVNGGFGLWSHAAIGLLSFTLFVGYVLNSMGIHSRSPASSVEVGGRS